MQILYFVVLTIVFLLTVAASAFVGIILYRWGALEQTKGERGSVKEVIPTLPKPPKKNKELIAKAEEEKRLRAEGFNNIMKYVNGEK